MPTMSFQDFRVGIDRRKSQQIVDQRGLYDCKNAFVNSGYAIKKRSGLDKITASQLDAGSKGLFEFDEKLYVVEHTTNATQTLSGYGAGGSYPINTNLYTLALPDPDDGSNTVLKVWQFLVFNNNLYVVVEYADGVIRHHYGTVAQMIAGTSVAVTDPDCPNGKSAVVHDSKIYAIEPDNNNPAYVKYSATEAPANWSKVKDASGPLGIPAGLEAMGNEHAVAVTSYRGFLAVFMQNSIQLWKTNPNPSLIELDTTVDNAFLEYHNSIGPISEDIFYLNSSGVHSVTQKLYTDTMATSDVGSPIADLVKTSITNNPTLEPKALFFPGENQYILALGTDMFIFTHSSKAELNAWTRYGTVTNLENIFSFNPSSFQDATKDTVAPSYPTSSIDLEILSSYNSLGKPGLWKQVYGSDVMFTGVADLQHRWDSRSTSEETTAFELSGDTRPGALIPVELMTTDISYKITKDDNTDFQLNGLTYYYNDLGLF